MTQQMANRTVFGRRKRFALAVLAALGTLLLLKPWEWPMPQKFFWTLQAEKTFIFSAYADEDETQVRVRAETGLQEIELPLAVRNYSRLRFKWGSESQRIEIKKMVLQGLLGSKTFSGRDLSRLVTAQGPLGVRFGKGEGIALDIREGGEAPLLIAQPHFRQLISRGKKTERMVLTLIVGFLLLALFHIPFYFSWRDGWGALKQKSCFRSILPLLLLIPMALAVWIRWPLRPVDERRLLALAPQFRLDEVLRWGGQIDQYVADHQGCRPLLVRFYNRFSVDILKTSPTESVLLGRKNWLFMGKERSDLDARRGYRGLDLFTCSELNAWSKLLLDRKRCLAAKGISYRLLVVPNKATVYPEFLPAAFQHQQRFSRLDQLGAHLAQLDEDVLLDIRTLLKQAKSRGLPIYHSSDSHWSAFGAFVACGRLLKDLEVMTPMLPLSEFEIYSGPRFGGDLAISLGLEMDRFSEKSWLRMARKDSDTTTAPVWKTLPDLGPYIRQQQSLNPRLTKGRLLLVHDSFAHELAPFLADHLQAVHLIWDWGLGFYPEVIEAFKPDWVVDEMAERYLYGPLPKNPF